MGAARLELAGKAALHEGTQIERAKCKSIFVPSARARSAGANEATGAAAVDSKLVARSPARKQGRRRQIKSNGIFKRLLLKRR